TYFCARRDPYYSNWDWYF
nr:immunoglobulin heavy chain junction region [Mus musculus]